MLCALTQEITFELRDSCGLETSSIVFTIALRHFNSMGRQIKSQVLRLYDCTTDPYQAGHVGLQGSDIATPSTCSFKPLSMWTGAKISPWWPDVLMALLGPTVCSNIDLRLDYAVSKQDH
jgi:hypothetical protein